MRISRPQLWMMFAEAAAMRSTCFRGGVGAVVVTDRDVVSIGYNGPPPGDDHCRGNDCPLTTEGGCTRSLHAEWNAVHRAHHKLKLVELHRCDLYCTYSPCLKCATYIVNSLPYGRFFYRYSYRDPAGLERISGKMPYYRITTSGTIVDMAGDIVSEELFK